MLNSLLSLKLTGDPSAALTRLRVFRPSKPLKLDGSQWLALCSRLTSVRDVSFANQVSMTPAALLQLTTTASNLQLLGCYSIDLSPSQLERLFSNIPNIIGLAILWRTEWDFADNALSKLPELRELVLRVPSYGTRGLIPSLKPLIEACAGVQTLYIEKAPGALCHCITQFKFPHLRSLSFANIPEPPIAA